MGVEFLEWSVPVWIVTLVMYIRQFSQSTLLYKLKLKRKKYYLSMVFLKFTLSGDKLLGGGGDVLCWGAHHHHQHGGSFVRKECESVHYT